MRLSSFGSYLTRWTAAIAFTALATGLASCQPQTPTATAPETSPAPGASPPAGGTVSISGAGASFPAPLSSLRSWVWGVGCGV